LYKDREKNGKMERWKDGIEEIDGIKIFIFAPLVIIIGNDLIE